MPQLRRLAISAEDPSKLAVFYQEVFDLERIGEEQGAIYLSDGSFSLALLPTRERTGRGFISLGFESARVESIQKKLAQLPDSHGEIAGCAPSSGIEYEIRDPDGNVIGLGEKAFDTAPSKGPVPIRHIALYTPHPARLADFYCKILDMKEVDRTDRSSIFVSDGYLNLALLHQRTEEPLGLNHFGFHVRSNEEMRARAEQAGTRRGSKRPDRIPFAEYRVHDPEGNGIDISEKGWKV